MQRRGTALTIGLAAALAAGVALISAPQPAGAQGLLESIFGGISRAFAPPAPRRDVRAYDEAMPEQLTPPTRAPERSISHGSGPVTVYCVRSCDGHYFPVQPHAGLSVAAACRAFCPASATRIYRGRSIDSAVASNGSRYADLPNAYVYRRHLVPGCTCNGRDAFGLAPIAPLRDPTLKPGDVVATRHGLVAFSGDKGGKPDFTPVQDYTRFSKRYREHLSTLRVAPPAPGAPGEFTPATSAAAGNHTAQLDR